MMLFHHFTGVKLGMRLPYDAIKTREGALEGGRRRFLFLLQELEGNLS
jgi:hypothetical protein